MRRHWLTGLLAIALIVTGAWGYNQYQTNQQNRILLENQHQRSFYNLVENVENLSVLTSKSIVSGSPQQNIRLLSDIWWQANFAQDNLGQLPLSHITLTRTQRFLTQLGDYAYTMAKNSSSGRPMSADQVKTLEDLHNQTSQLSKDLIELQKQVAENGISWQEIRSTSKEKLDQESTNYLNTNFTKMNEQINQYPTLIYDGPFSDHLITKNPKAIKGDMIGWDDAKRIAREFVDLREGVDYLVAENGKSTKNANIPVYSVRIAPRVPNMGEVIYVDVSQQGGHVTLVMNSRDVGEAKIGLAEALEKAKSFLAKTEFKSMVPTYSLRQENTVVVSFAYKENDVIVYPDLVKVNVSLDNGQITGFESTGYLMQHEERKLPEPKLTIEEAAQKLNPLLNVKSKRLTLIPTETGKEVLCYEFKGSYKEDEFLVYINALDGVEEQILQLLHTPGGTWAM
ncbi:MAG: germination protein YpeB [Bacillota bacterium]|jgi:spore germination protein